MNRITIKDISIKKLEIPFRISFSHTQATRNKTDSVLVIAKSKNGIFGHGEGSPRSYVTQETSDSAISFFNQHQSEIIKISCLDDLLRAHEILCDEIDRNPSGWCAIESAILDLISRENFVSIEKLLNLPELTGFFKYSAILDSSGIDTFRMFLTQYKAQGFTDYKLKISGNLQQDQEKISMLVNDSNQFIRIRVDANNLWNDPKEAIHYLKALKYDFFAVEEPLKVNDFSGLIKIASELQTKIVLDESFINQHQFEKILGHPFWVINLRISKMGGLIRSIHIAELAKKYDIPLIIGAQVGESSILTRAALTIANAFRDNLLAQEGGFGTKLLEYDIVEPSLMFERSGKLNASIVPKYLRFMQEP